MNKKLSRVLPGLFLILAGALAFLVQLGRLSDRAPQFWIAVFAAFGLLFLVAYFLSEVRAWGWLFPAFLCAALALTIYLGQSGVSGPIIGTPVLAALGLPFLFPLARDVRKNWWALIPAWVMAVVAAIVAVADRIPGQWIAAIVLFGFALPFLFVFLWNRTRWWALIPAFVFAVIAVIPLMTLHMRGEYIGGLINIFIGVPFLAAYFLSRRAWWAILPGGIMSAIGVMIILIGILSPSPRAGSLGVGVMFALWALAFALLWRRPDLHPAEWAKYPALALGVLAVVMFFSAATLSFAWPILLIAGGLLLLYLGFRPRAPSQKL